MIAPDLAPELSEPKRYFVVLHAPFHARPRWTSLPHLDAPATGDLFSSAARQFSDGKVQSVDPVFHSLGTDKVRVYLMTSSGDFVVYKEGVRNEQLYVVNVNHLKQVIALADPLRELDAYVSSVIRQTIAYSPRD